MELEVLQGGVVTIAKHRPVLFIELEEKNLSRYNSTTQNVLDLLESLGYSEFYISSTYGKLNLIDKKDILKLKAGINIFCIPSNIPNWRFCIYPHGGPNKAIQWKEYLLKI